ncbi:MAG: YlxR family protein [Thermodesulfobacteriota bacterium]
MRTCLGCRRRAPRACLYRFALDEDGVVRLDAAGRFDGRHAYCCKENGCWKKFCKNTKGLAKAFRRQIGGFDEELNNLFGSG